MSYWTIQGTIWVIHGIIKLYSIIYINFKIIEKNRISYRKIKVYGKFTIKLDIIFLVDCVLCNINYIWSVYSSSWLQLVSIHA